LRAELQQRWPALLGLALLVGLAGGVVLVVIVGTALIANLAAAIPAWHAARLPTAAVLRTE
jgi:ABC-type lipoprotein release transport system permease subunit